MITKITRIYTRTYTDSGQVTTYIEWVDNAGERGRTEGHDTNPHMQALIARGQREGVKLETEIW
jgi:hypothetical protein